MQIKADTFQSHKDTNIVGTYKITLFFVRHINNCLGTGHVVDSGDATMNDTKLFLEHPHYRSY